MRFRISSVRVTTTQPTRASSSQRPRRRILAGGAAFSEALGSGGSGTVDLLGLAAGAWLSRRAPAVLRTLHTSRIPETRHASVTNHVTMLAARPLDNFRATRVCLARSYSSVGLVLVGNGTASPVKRTLTMPFTPS